MGGLDKSRKNIRKCGLNNVNCDQLLWKVLWVVTILSKGARMLLGTLSVCVCVCLCGVKDYPVVGGVGIIMWNWPYRGS